MDLGDAGDSQRQALLSSRGYTPIHEATEHHWRRSLELSIPDPSIAEGYLLRPLGDVSELPSRSWASWRAFHPNEPGEKYDPDWSWYQNIQSAPLYRPDLDLVAIAPAGDVAAFTTAWYEAETRTGYFEPVDIVPEHQRRGLASALLYHGLHRLNSQVPRLPSLLGARPTPMRSTGLCLDPSLTCRYPGKSVGNESGKKIFLDYSWSFAS